MPRTPARLSANRINPAVEAGKIAKPGSFSSSMFKLRVGNKRLRIHPRSDTELLELSVEDGFPGGLPDHPGQREPAQGALVPFDGTSEQAGVVATPMACSRDRIDRGTQVGKELCAWPPGQGVQSMGGDD